MKTIIPKLKDLVKEMPDIIPSGIITVSNIDDIFREIRSRGINKVKIEWREMLIIALFFVANSGLWSGKVGEKGQIAYEDDKWTAIKIMREGKVDKYLGVKLILDE